MAKQYSSDSRWILEKEEKNNNWVTKPEWEHQAELWIGKGKITVFRQYMFTGVDWEIAGLDR